MSSVDFVAPMRERVAQGLPLQMYRIGGRGPWVHYCSMQGCRSHGWQHCDWNIGDGLTCDRAVCDEHASSPAPGKHLCPEHQAAWLEQLWSAG